MSFVCGRTKREMSLAAGVFLFVAHSLWAQKPPDAASRELPAEIRIRANASPKTATVGDPVRIDLDIILPPGYRAEIPKPVGQSDEVSIVDFFPGPELPDGNAPGAPAPPPPRAEPPARHRARTIIAIYRTGKFTFPSIPLKIISAAGEEFAASSPPVDIEIQTVLTEKNPGLKDLKKQAEIPEPVRWLLWSMVALAACLLCATAWYFLRRRKRKPVTLTPAQKQDLLELAEADLRRLLAQGFPESGSEKRHYVLLSDVLKRILSAGYGIHTAERTTSEITEALDLYSVPAPEERRRIESFLLRCDIVKFAKHVPSGDEHAGAAEDALRILAVAKETVGRQQAVAAGDGRPPAAE